MFFVFICTWYTVVYINFGSYALRSGHAISVWIRLASRRLCLWFGTPLSNKQAGHCITLEHLLTGRWAYMRAFISSLLLHDIGILINVLWLSKYVWRQFLAAGVYYQNPKQFDLGLKECKIKYLPAFAIKYCKNSYTSK